MATDDNMVTACWQAPISHSRAELIDGWDQSKIANAQVILCTTTPEVTWDLFWLFAGAQAMGFQTILAYLSPDSRTSPRPARWPKETFAHECAFVQPQPSLVDDELSLLNELDLGRPAVCIPAELHPSTFATTVTLAESLQKPALLPTGTAKQVALLEVNPSTAASDRVQAYMRLACLPPRHPAISLFLAALVLERTRQLFAPLEDDVPPARPLHVTTGVTTLRTRIEEPVYLIGVGGIGAPAALLLASCASEVTIIDHDVAEPSNRARAPWLIPGVPKVFAVEEFVRFLSDRMSISPAAQFHPRVEKVTDGTFLAHTAEPVSVIAAVDNWQARAMLSRLTVERCRHHQPTLLVNAGCSPTGASVSPIGGNGGYACLHHRLPINIDELAAREQQAQSCGQMPAASILYTNWAAAALAVLSLLNAEPIAVEYNCRNPNRLYLRPLFQCPCFS